MARNARRSHESGNVSVHLTNHTPCCNARVLAYTTVGCAVDTEPFARTTIAKKQKLKHSTNEKWIECFATFGFMFQWIGHIALKIDGGEGIPYRLMSIFFDKIINVEQIQCFPNETYRYERKTLCMVRT